MSKKTWTLIACLVLSLTLGLGGSLAYLTDTDTKVNTFTMGEVQISVEENFGANGSFEESIRPGAEVNKDAWIANTGANDAYVWMTVAVPSELDGIITLNWTDDAKWPNNKIDYITQNVLGEDNKYYTVYTVLVNKVLEPGKQTPILLDSVTMSAQVDYENGKFYLMSGGTPTPIEYDMHNFKVYVTGFAIQAEGFANVEAAYANYGQQWGNMVVATGPAVKDEGDQGGTEEERKDPPAVYTESKEDVSAHIDLEDESAEAACIAAKGANVVVTIKDGFYQMGCNVGKHVVSATDGATVKINGGVYVNQYNPEQIALIYAGAGSKVEIHGGTFLQIGNDAVPPTTGWMKAEEAGSIVIYGGAFCNWDPTSFLATGYKATLDTTTDYYVVEPVTTEEVTQ